MAGRMPGDVRRGARRVAGAMAVAGLVFGAFGPAGAQESVARDSLVEDSVDAPDSLAADAATGISPAGAFLRGAIIPGWGHAATGSLTRGAFYFSAEALAGWMVFKTQRRLGVAQDQAALWEARVTAELMAQGLTEFEQIEAGLENDERVARFRGLVDARKEQREDWLAVAIFTLLLSGVDAFVSAHLGDFPEPLTIEGDPEGGVVGVGFRLPIG